MNIGILGAGSFGEKHINVLKNINIFNIQGFYDPNTDISKEIEKKFQIKYYDNPDQLIKECNAIDIVSETASHYALIDKVMKYQKHIFIEKPICCQKLETENILKKTKQYQPTIQIGHIERYNPTINTGNIDFKNINSIETKRTGSLNERNRNTSITLDLMIHDIDLIISNIQSKLIKIEASGKQQYNIFHNHIDCTLLFENGITANLKASRGENMKNERIMKLYSNKEILELDFIKKLQKRIQKNHESILECNKDTNPLEDEFVAFYQSIKNGTKPIASVEEACAAVDVAIEIDEIINKG